MHEIALQGKTIFRLLQHGIKIKSIALLVPAYQIAIQQKWQPQSFWMARELFEAYILAEEWETAIGIFQNHLLLLGSGSSFPDEIRRQVVHACRRIGHPGVTVKHVQTNKWQTIEFLNNRKQ